MSSPPTGTKGCVCEAHASESSSEISAVTGEALEYGPYAACIQPLEADYYIVTVDGAQDEDGKATQLEARVQVDKRFIPRWNSSTTNRRRSLLSRPPPHQHRRLRCKSRKRWKHSRKRPPEAACALPPPLPALAPGGPSRLCGFAPDASGRSVRVIDAVGNERRTAAGSEGRFCFDALPPGIYSLFVEGGYQQGNIELDGTADVEVLFAPVMTGTQP